MKRMKTREEGEDKKENNWTRLSENEEDWDYHDKRVRGQREEHKGEKRRRSRKKKKRVQNEEKEKKVNIDNDVQSIKQ